MPYASEAQRRYFYSQLPADAAKRDKEGENYIKGQRKTARQAKRSSSRKSSR